jgi:serine-type D-Ala-D-Ala carboxypeptidase (penicillin-binding protein 5/6)
VLYEKNADERRPTASVTKVLTAITAFERQPESKQVTVSKHAASIGEATANLKPGDVVNFDDLMAMVLLPSANDAAMAMAEHVGGSVSAFVDMMNETARSLGCDNTHYVNPHGLDADGHYSTARDVATQARHLLDIPLCANLVRTQKMAVPKPGKPGETMELENSNLLLGWRSDVDGVKTGFTSPAGQCLAASARRGDRGYVVVVLGSDGRFHEASALLDWAFETWDMLPVLTAGDEVATAKLERGAVPTVGVSPNETLELLLRIDRPLPEARFVQTASEAPVLDGDPLGTFVIQHEGTRYEVRGLATAPVPLIWWRRVFGWPQGALLIGCATLLALSAAFVTQRAMSPRPRPSARRPGVSRRPLE